MKEEAGTLPNSFHEASVILVPKPDKDGMEKKKRQLFQLVCSNQSIPTRPISLMNLDIKVLNKILTN